MRKVNVHIVNIHFIRALNMLTSPKTAVQTVQYVHIYRLLYIDNKRRSTLGEVVILYKMYSKRPGPVFTKKLESGSCSSSKI